MTPHEKDHVRLLHMLDHAVEARQMAAGQSRPSLDTDRKLELALVRLLEIVGEAAARVSREFQDAHGEIEWPAIVGPRNLLIHGYDKVDRDILWDIIDKDLPPLIDRLNRLVPADE